MVKEFGSLILRDRLRYRHDAGAHVVNLGPVHENWEQYEQASADYGARNTAGNFENREWEDWFYANNDAFWEGANAQEKENSWSHVRGGWSEPTQKRSTEAGPHRNVGTRSGRPTEGKWT